MVHELRAASFDSSGVEVAADLWLPEGFDDSGSYAAVAVATPGSSVKGQVGASYGRRLADRGFVALAYDPSYQGQSGGRPRDRESPAARVADIRAAVDHLTTLPFVDVDRMGLLGVCAGGGYTARAALTEHRVAAVATVTGVNLGRAYREANAALPGGVVGLLGEVGAQRTFEARGGDRRRTPWVPSTPEEAVAQGMTDRDALESVDYYRTSRGFDEHSTNRLLFTSNAEILDFDAFHLADQLLTQPLLVVVGGRRGSTGAYEDGVLLQGMAQHAEELAVIDGAGHYDLYDKPEFVDPAVDRLAVFFGTHLVG